MDSLITTIAIAFVVVALAIAGLAIGWLITGRSKLTPGGCGRAPQDPACDEKKDSCGLCQSEEKDEQQ